MGQLSSGFGDVMSSDMSTEERAGLSPAIARGYFQTPRGSIPTEEVESCSGLEAVRKGRSVMGWSQVIVSVGGKSRQG